MTDHYDTLGVSRDATADDIKAAFRRCASKAHPDRQGGSSERMQAVNRAYGVLGDAAKRERYDLTGSDDFLDVEKAAADLLASVFDQAISSDVDPLDFAHTMLGEAKAKTASRGAELKSLMQRLQKQRGRIKVKAGENMVETIIARRIAAAEREQAQLGDASKVQARFSEMLSGYEGPPKPAPGSIVPISQLDWERQYATGGTFGSIFGSPFR